MMNQITFSQLINSLRNDTDVAFLLGAGCSLSSGCLSAQGLVRLFKTNLYCAENGIDIEDVTSFDELKFQALVDKRYVNDTEESDYSYFFRSAYPIAKDRDMFIKNRFWDKSPSTGYLYFADYLIRNKVKTVYTTNFDSLVEKAVRKLDENYDIGSLTDGIIPHLNNKLLIVKLHGDYGYSFTKNTEEELRRLSSLCHQSLTACNAQKILVMGYSGSDQSVMSALNVLLETNARIHLIWCMYGNEAKELNQNVRSLLQRKNTTLAVGVNFDELFERLYHSGDNARLDELIKPQSHILKWRGSRMPKEDLETNLFVATALPTIFLSDMVMSADKAEVDAFETYRGKCYSFQNSPGSTAFAFNDSDLPIRLKKTLIKKQILQVAKGNGKAVFGNNILFSRSENGLCLGLHVGIETVGDRYYLVLHPKYFFSDERYPSAEDLLLIGQKTRGLYANKHHDALQRMIVELFPNGLDFSIDENSLTFSSEPKKLMVKDKQASVMSEPMMEINGKYSVNQIALLSQYGPIATGNFGQESINICVLSLKSKKKPLYEGLIQELLCGSKNRPSSKSIVPEYPGFEALFHVHPNIIRTPIDVEKGDCVGKSFDVFLDTIAKKVEQVYDAADPKPDIILVHFSEEMSKFRSDAQYDFHDMLKLRLIGKCKTQIIEESTLKSRDDKNKILFNLATAIYTKSVGMPWRPLQFERNKFFLGMAFGSSGKGINVSCSQLFDGSGNGMKLIVSPIGGGGRNDPRFQKNPYLTKTEARELGKRILALHARSSSPFDIRKIVVHRTTPFRDEEIEGFGEAFHGLDDYVLLQIVETPQPFAYVMKNKKDISGYPPLRGTAIQLREKEALLWTDGSVRDAAVWGENCAYRNSSSGVSSPILIRIFHGKTSIEEVCDDILYLTKMDFNSSDALYSRLPVSIKYAKKLAHMLKYASDGSLSGEIDFRFIM